MERRTRSSGIRAAGIILAALSHPAFCQVLINGAGATFPYPIYARWFDEFHRLRPGALINYESVGSGAGMRQLLAGVLDLGASDMPLSDADAARFPNGVLHIPTVVGAVVPAYNIPGIRKELNFSQEALSGILLGKITKWNDRELAAANPGVRLPNAQIVVVHRSDGSGSTFILSEFLSKTSEEWKSAVGVGASLRWRTGIGAKGNEGVAGIVHQMPFSLGYVELVYAEQNRMTYGRVRNSSGRYIRAGMSSIKLAAATVANSMPGDFRVSITNPAGGGAYPIASYTWLLTPARIPDPEKRRIIVDFLRWMLSSGQPMAEAMGYAPLPKPVAAQALSACGNIR
jgi:phosphate transport system substrate-binding protein